MPTANRVSTVRTPTSHPVKPAAVVKTPSKGHTTVTIDFRAAAAQAKGQKEFKVASTPFADVYLTKIELGDKFVLTNKNLPPYSVVIRPKKGMPEDLYIHHDTGSSSWDLPAPNNYGDTGDNIVSTGTESVKFEKGYDSNKFIEKLTITLDTQNDYERKPPKKASLESKPYREAWNKNWDRHDTYFTFDKGIANGSLKTVTAAEFKKLPGAAAIIKEIEEGGGTMADFIRRDTLKIAKDAKTGSYALINYTLGEIEHTMYVLDKKGKQLGQWEVDADAQRYWVEH